MRSAARGFSAPAFDQGIFLLRLNKGKEALQHGDVVKARVELEEGLKLRPRDEMVMNLLGMVYFRLDMRHEAAEIYRTLLAVHPEADILHSNLGILEFKEGRHEEATRSLTEALKLNPRNPKPHLYLGLIARLDGRYDDCLDHLRKAGADALVARISASKRPSRDEESPLDDTAPMKPLGPPGSGADTAASGGEVIEFVKKGAGMGAGSSAPPERGSLDLREIVEGHERRRSLVGESLFALKGTSVLELAFLGRVCVRKGAVILASGEMAASELLPGFAELAGPGRVLLSGGNSTVFLFPLSAQRVYVSEARLLAWEGSLDAAAIDATDGLERASVRLRDTGSLALTVGPQPIVVELRSGHPLRIAEGRLVAWTDDVEIRLERASGVSFIMGGEVSVAVATGEGQILIDAA
jgi:hypothetical protein